MESSPVAKSAPSPGGTSAAHLKTKVKVKGPWRSGSVSGDNTQYLLSSAQPRAIKLQDSRQATKHEQVTTVIRPATVGPSTAGQVLKAMKLQRPCSG